MAGRVYIARLAGTSVFDPSGDEVGKVRDVVVALRLAPSRSRVLGLVVEVPPRRSVFLPMGRVTEIDAGMVVTTGLLNMRRFQRRTGESLVVAEVLDRRMRLRGSSEEVSLLDVAMERDPARSDWYLTKAFVRSGGGGFRRRRGTESTVDWVDVQDPGLVREQGADRLLSTLDDLSPPDLARALQDLSVRRRLDVARQLDDERLANVLEELPEDDRVEILRALDRERAADVLEEMDPDDAADLLGELPPEQAQAFLALMAPDEAADLRRLLSYDDYTAGGMMTTEPVILAPNATVAEALARVRSADLSPAQASQVYVVRSPFEPPTGPYLGTAHIQALLREPPARLVARSLDRQLHPIGPDAPLGEVARYFATYNLVAVPVVDGHGHLLGAVTVDDLIDHMLPEDWREQGPEGVQRGR